MYYLYFMIGWLVGFFCAMLLANLLLDVFEDKTSWDDDWNKW